jgi:HlyD family secretion protein
MRMGRRQIVWIVLAVAVVTLVVWALRPVPIEVETAAVGREPLVVSIEEEGETRLRQRFAVSAPVAGRVLRIEARPGDAVRAGQVVAAITPARPVPLDDRTRAAAEARVRTADATLEGARADRRRLEAARDQAVRDAARTRTLFQAGSVARDAAELADLAARSAEEAVSAATAAVRAAEFALAEAKAALVSTTGRANEAQLPIASPIDGLVLRRVQESESVVAAGAPLIEIGDLRDLEVVSDLLSRDAVRVKPGARVVITNWGGPADLRGQVDRVEPSGFTKISALGVEEQRVNVVISLVDPPAARPQLGDGFRVEVRIVLSERSGVRATPTASLFRQDGRWAVFVVGDDSRIRRREVEIGDQNERITEVIKGLNEGDRVVVYPGESLTDGAEVAAR